MNLTSVHLVQIPNNFFLKKQDKPPTAENIYLNPSIPSSPLTVEVDLHAFRCLLFDLVSWHAVLHSTLEHRVLVSPGGLHVQDALKGIKARGLLHHRGNHVGFCQIKIKNVIRWLASIIKCTARKDQVLLSKGHILSFLSLTSGRGSLFLNQMILGWGCPFLAVQVPIWLKK